MKKQKFRLIGFFMLFLCLTFDIINYEKFNDVINEPLLFKLGVLIVIHMFSFHFIFLNKQLYLLESPEENEELDYKKYLDDKLDEKKILAFFIDLITAIGAFLIMIGSIQNLFQM